MKLLSLLSLIILAFAQEKTLYTCGMHPQVIKDEPGSCPICFMELTPLIQAKKSSLTTSVHVSDEWLQNFSVKTMQVTQKTAKKSYPLYAVFAENEENTSVITVKTDIWIEKMLVNKSGQVVNKDDILFYFYSPKVSSLISELQTAAKFYEENPSKLNQDLLELSKKKAEQLDLNSQDLLNLTDLKRVPFRSRFKGFVAEKLKVNGEKVMDGQGVYRLIDDQSIWLLADFYDNQLNLKTGEMIEIQCNYGVIHAKIDMIYPYMDKKTKSKKVRFQLDNRHKRYRINDIISGSIEFKRSERILVPIDAVIKLDNSENVILQNPDKTFTVRAVKTGDYFGRELEIISGLKVGETLVISSQFLIDSESKLQNAIEKMNHKEASHSEEHGATETYEINTPSIVCETCEETITKGLKELRGVSHVQVLLNEKKVKVTAKKNSLNDIENKISALGYHANAKRRDAVAYEQLKLCCKD